MVWRSSSLDVGHDGEGVVEGGVGEDVEGERAGEPDEIFAAGKGAEVAGERVERVEGVAGAELGLEAGVLGFELLDAGDGGGGGSGFADDGVGERVGVGAGAGGVVEQDWRRGGGFCVRRRP